MKLHTIYKSNYYALPLISIFLILFLTTGFVSNSKDQHKKVESASNIDSTNIVKVAILGLFHFGGSSGDLASMKMDNPFGKRRQDDIKELVTKLKEFQPTKILVEYSIKNQKRLQERYERYLSGTDTLGVNEIDQVGFRLAKSLGHTQIYAIDYKMNLPGDELAEYCQRNNKMGEFESFIKNIQEFVAAENQILDTMSISDYLARTNTDEADQLTNDSYIGNSLSWGDSINEAGANFAATWWKRNFIILKNIAETIDNKQDRILIIIGSGHRAVLKNLIIDRSDMDYVEIGDYLN